MAFSRRPTSHLLIESQMLTIWPWYDLDLIYDLDLRQLKLSETEVAKFSMRWPWSNDLDTQTWPRYSQDVTPYQKWSFYVNSFKSYSPNRQTDRHTRTHTDTDTDTTKTLLLPHTRQVINHTTNLRSWLFTILFYLKTCMSVDLWKLICSCHVAGMCLHVAWRQGGR